MTITQHKAPSLRRRCFVLFAKKGEPVQKSLVDYSHILLYNKSDETAGNEMVIFSICCCGDFFT